MHASRPLLRALPVFACLVMAGLALAARPAHADIYRYIGKDGVTYFSDHPLTPAYRLYLRGGTPPLAYKRAPRYQDYVRNRRRYRPLIDRAAREIGVSRDLVEAVVSAESAYDPHAVSLKGAVGLMQLMPATAARYGVHDIRNPRQNVYAGIRYLRDLLLQFGNVALAVAAYNAGAKAVIGHGETVPPYPETRVYVRRVLDFYRKARAAN